MGGTLILLALVAATLLFADLRNRLVWTVLLVTVGFGAIGFVDDWLKISKRNSKGLPGRQKLVWQTVIVLAVYLVFLTDWNFQLAAAFPFLTWAPTSTPTSPCPSSPPAASTGTWAGPTCPSLLVVVGTSNAVNLTDGLDGLAIGPSIVSAVAFLVLAYVAGTTIAGFSLAAYLGIPPVHGAEELAVFCAAMAGRGHRLPLVQHLPGLGVHGRRGLAGPRRRARHAGRPHQERGGLGHPARRLPGRGGERHRAGGLVQDHREAGLPHGPHPPPLRAPGLWPSPKIIVRFWIISIMLALVALMSLKLR